MFQTMIQQEKNMRKDIQDIIRKKLGAHKDANQGGNLYFNHLAQFQEALILSKNALSLDLKVFNEQIEEALVEFQNMNEEASLTLHVEFDPQNIEAPENQTYDAMIHVSSLGILTSSMPISDLTHFCQILNLADHEPKYEDDLVF